jgi:hypothetical protein
MRLHSKRCENMSGLRTITANAVLILSAASLSAATPEYLPLQVGNSWVYKTTQGRASRVQMAAVEAVESVDGRSYYRVQFFERTVLVRQTEDGSLVSYDPATKQERLWLPFASAEGQRTNSEFDPCSKSATVRSKSASVKTSIGDFTNALQLTYEPSCGDAGISTQFFLPYVGLVQQESTTIAGPQRYELLYSRTGLTNIETQQISFAMALDGHTYRVGQDAEMIVRLTLRSSHPDPIELMFPSGQSYDLKIYNDRGESVYTWSADKIFAQVVRTERFGPGEKTFAFSVPVGQFPAGRYAAEGYLTTQPRLFSAVVQFEVR